MGFGRGFILHTVEGWTYTFDMASRATRGPSAGLNTVNRARILLLRRRSDPFGNYVAYAYNANGHRSDRGLREDGRRLLAGARITLNYDRHAGCTGTRVCSATARGRTWNFDYDGSGHLSWCTAAVGRHR